MNTASITLLNSTEAKKNKTKSQYKKTQSIWITSFQNLTKNNSIWISFQMQYLNGYTNVIVITDGVLSEWANQYLELNTGLCCVTNQYLCQNFDIHKIQYLLEFGTLICFFFINSTLNRFVRKSISCYVNRIHIFVKFIKSAVLTHSMYT